MPSILNLPVLTLGFVPSTLPSGERPAERDIDRNALVAISPDREELFMNRDMPIDGIRQSLKLRIGPGHWVHQTKRRANEEFRDATARTSALLIRQKAQDENKPPVPRLQLQRMHSSVSLNRDPRPRTHSETGLARPTAGTGGNAWESFVFVTTPLQVISPRPLDPTHILVVHSEPLVVTKSGKNILPRSGLDGVKPSFPNMDIVINDVLFALGAPNLVAVNGKQSLPRRLHKELPRVLLHVPSLETFPEVIVYLHSYNQADLFRKLIPEWMRDLMHPLPLPATLLKEAPFVAPTPHKARGPASILGRLAAASRSNLKLASSASSTYSVDTVSSGISRLSIDSTATYEHNADTIARDIVDSLPFFSSKEPLDDELVGTVSTLNALKANLEFLGYYGKAVWDELEMSLTILTRALIHRASVAEAE
ncbi:hypothetical protein R3P38DRAFT_2891100 [Favolaschia claudopus]|uniref:Uncharacterized protein n=1 Tax=Favolaschia claudopus TaxID=2862362 RepID=A0AAW0CV39_9AGAR